ncbi:SURF1 family protein [Pseudomaricurvus sp.]|uniref:SURF1 family protein n=1 Tax=Pseudomaricurvus sp. TaxID=2004510 RepID=UPI003F6CD0A0
MSASSESSEKFSVTSRWNWKLISVGLVLLTILIRLGFWQLDRAEEKNQLVSSIEHRQSLPPLSLNEFPDAVIEDSLFYRKVRMSGQFDAERYWLVDNKTHQGKVGYEVVAPFYTSGGAIVLVNRGWIEAPSRRELLPEVEFPESTVEITGRTVPISVNKMVRNISTEESKGQWPVRIQQLTTAVAEQALLEAQVAAPVEEQIATAVETEIASESILAGVLQLSPNDPNALTMIWRDINVSPEKHQGYAVQWFAMAFVLVIALVVANTNIRQSLIDRQSARVKQ